MKISKDNKKAGVFVAVFILLIASLAIPISVGEKFENQFDVNQIQEENGEEKFVLAIGPVGFSKKKNYEVIRNLSESEALKIKDIFFGNHDSQDNHDFRNNILEFFEEYNLTPQILILSEILQILEKTMNKGNINSIQQLSDNNNPPSHLCVGPHVFVYASPFSAIFAYNIQGISLFKNIQRIEDILNVTEEKNPVLYMIFNTFTDNMSILEYADIKGAMIVIGGSLGRYWSLGLLDSSFGDMTFKITGPFVGMYAFVADVGIYIFEDPKDGEGVEKPWLDIALGVSLFSMQLQTIVDFTPK